MEVWFAGTHSDIGGGNARNVGMDRSRPPLRWMASEAEALGLRLRSFERELSSNEQIEFQESLTWLWKPFEILPFRRLTFARNIGSKSTTRRPHLGAGRKIHPGQKIHSSLILANQNTYIPKARAPPPEGQDNQGRYQSPGTGSALYRLFPWLRQTPAESADQRFWTELLGDGLSNSKNWLEVDIFQYARAIIAGCMDERDGSEETLKQIIHDHSGQGAQAVYDGVMEVIAVGENRTVTPKAGTICQLLGIATRVFKGHRKGLELQTRRKIRATLSRLSMNEEEQKVTQDFLQQCTSEVNCLFELEGHLRLVSSVFISPNGERIVSGSCDKTIRIWDMEEGEQVGSSLRGHDDWIRSVAISPNGELIVSGSDDRTIRVWDAKTGTQVGESLQGHESWVQPVAFSHDGKRIVSGSSDGTIRTWEEVEERRWTQVGDPIRGHDGPIFSIAISPDDKYIVSGSDDRTIRIWDAKERTQVGEPLRGHENWVWSVAISPDGNRIVSGSRDNTIRIWDVEKREQVGDPLRGHSNDVRSVAISSDGKYIVSGSDDRTIRIWDLEKREQVGEPLRGHTVSVTSVAISPDGKRIVSGSYGSTVRIWSAEGILV
ncbi:hypothetical protein MD484_g9053, partial [Candolleomyces efflorescens]